MTGRDGPLRRATDASSLTATISLCAVGLRLFEIAHVPGVQNVEAAVRHDHALAARLRFLDERVELGEGHEAAAAAALAMQGELQLRARDGRDADLAHDDSGAEVRERGGLRAPIGRRRAPPRAAR